MKYFSLIKIYFHYQYTIIIKENYIKANITNKAYINNFNYAILNKACNFIMKININYQVLDIINRVNNWDHKFFQ